MIRLYTGFNVIEASTNRPVFALYQPRPVSQSSLLFLSSKQDLVQSCGRRQIVLWLLPSMISLHGSRTLPLLAVQAEGAVESLRLNMSVAGALLVEVETVVCCLSRNLFSLHENVPVCFFANACFASKTSFPLVHLQQVGKGHL